MNSNYKKGFTLVELLVVMGILGVLAVIVLVSINPGQKQAQARDTGRISSVAQIGRVLQAYYTVNDAAYPASGNWAQDLVDKGELSIFPSGIGYAIGGVSGCTTVPQPADPQTYCYDEDQVSGNGAIVFSIAEADSHRSKCTSPEQAYFVFSTADGRGGTICSNGDPSAWASGTQSYED